MKNFNDFRTNKVESIDEAFYRLPTKVIKNELFSANKALAALTSSQLNGDDLDVKQLASVLKSLQAVQKTAKKFNKPGELPADFRLGVTKL